MTREQAERWIRELVGTPNWDEEVILIDGNTFLSYSRQAKEYYVTRVLDLGRLGLNPTTTHRSMAEAVAGYMAMIAERT